MRTGGIATARCSLRHTFRDLINSGSYQSYPDQSKMPIGELDSFHIIAGSASASCHLPVSGKHKGADTPLAFLLPY